MAQTLPKLVLSEAKLDPAGAAMLLLDALWLRELSQRAIRA